MKKKLFFWITAFAVFLLVIAVVGAIYYFFVINRGPVLVPQSALGFKNSGEPGFEGWKKYTNKDMDFEIMYPADLTVSGPETMSTGMEVTFLKGEDTIFIIRNGARYNQSLQREYTLAEYLSASFPVFKKGEFRKDVIFGKGNYNGVRIDKNYTETGGRLFPYLFAEYIKNKYHLIFEMSGNTPGGNGTLPKNYDSYGIFEKMISTFKFTGQGNITDYRVIYRPTGGEKYELGQSMEIKWDPAKIDVQYIQFVPGSGNTDSSEWFQFYDKQYQGETTGGRFSYTLPEDISSLPPGNYKVKISDKTRKINFFSNDFEIVSSYPFVEEKAQDSFYIKNITGNLPSYNKGDLIKIYMDAREGDNSLATPDKGFNAWAIYGLASAINQETYSMNMAKTFGSSYLSELKQWELYMKVPDNLICGETYIFRAQLFCEDRGPGSVCAQKYRGQSTYTDRDLLFKVNCN